MKLRNPHILIPTLLAGSSSIGLLLLGLLTNPVQNVSYALFFFGLLLVLLLSLGHLAVYLRRGKVTATVRSKIVIISVLLVFLLMFRSAGSLNWADLLVMVLLSFGLLFYSGRR